MVIKYFLFQVYSQFLIIMPLVAMISDAILKVRKAIPQVSAIHLRQCSLQEAKSAVFIFTNPESIINGCGRLLLQTASVAKNIRAVFVDEFHIIESW